MKHLAAQSLMLPIWIWKELQWIARSKKLRDQMSLKMAEIIYNGFWFSPEMKTLLNFMKDCQENVTGIVKLKLYKGLAYPIARTSPVSLYDADLSSFDQESGYNMWIG